MGRTAKAEAQARTVEFVPVARLVPADWNYKKPATPEVRAKLVASIQRDASAGVLAVRELGKGKLEVIDGNHRLEAIREIGWATAPIENFGKITKAEAVLIAQRRNHQWFEDDTPTLAKLFKDVVLPEFDLDALEEFMPTSRASMEQLAKLADFDWSALPDAPETSEHLSFVLTDDLKELWARWYPVASTMIGEGASKGDIIELALKTALAATKEP